MKKILLKALKNPLVTGSMIVLATSQLDSVLNLLFSLYMTRNLSVADYGSFVSLVSVYTSATVLTGWISLTVTHFGAVYHANNDTQRIRALFFQTTKFSAALGLFFSMLFFAMAGFLGSFFRIDNSNLIHLVTIAVFFSFLGIANGALIQARLNFRAYSVIALLATVVKLAGGIALVFLGFRVGGAFAALVLSVIVQFLLGYIPLRDLLFLKGQNVSLHIRSLFLYGLAAAATISSFTFLINTDILLVKHFFDPESAGLYAGLSLVGKIIFFLSGPVTIVMFPLFTQKHAREEKHNTHLLVVLVSVFAVSIFLSALYFLFPRIFIDFILHKATYRSIAGMLGIFGVNMTFYSLLSVMVYYFLSTKKTLVWIPMLFGAVLQAVLLFFYHSSFLQVILISIAVTGGLFFVLFAYYLFGMPSWLRKFL